MKKYSKKKIDAGKHRKEQEFTGSTRHERTLVSWWLMRQRRAGKISVIISKGGGGSLLRHRLTSTHVTLRRKASVTAGVMKEMSGLTMPS